jgi:hypothetical protein
MGFEGLTKIPRGTDKYTSSCCCCCQSIVGKSDLDFCDSYELWGFLRMEMYKLKKNTLAVICSNVKLLIGHSNALQNVFVALKCSRMSAPVLLGSTSN